MMVLQEIKDLIVNYIRDCDGKATKNKVADYMTTAAPQKYSISKVTTLGVIKELEESGRIKISKGERSGQSHYLSVVNESWFDRLTEQIENIGTFLRGHPEEVGQERGLNLLLWNLARTHKYIKNQKDRESLIQKIIDLLLKVRYKKEGLADTV